MFDIINQSIKVQAQFDKGQLTPICFTWGQAEFSVDKIVFNHHRRLGQAVLSVFSVLSNQITYELQFNNQTLVWQLLKVYDSSNSSC
jgi:hypothetical protein